MNSSSHNFQELTHNEIAERAHTLWSARGCPNGRDDEIWLEAERQLATERSLKPLGRDHRGGSGAKFDIDEKVLAERLDEFGDPGTRSATSLDPTR